MKVGVSRESWPGENRVALIPSAVAGLKKAGLEVVVERDAGARAGFTSQAYERAGAATGTRDEVFGTSDILLQVRSVPVEAGRLRSGQVVIGFADPLGSPDAVDSIARTGAMAFSMELMPRITRAQSMDALSSMATISGYKAVIMAADYLPRMFPMLMTAAGTITAAKVFVVGAGVAGLQAIAQAKRLGAKVEAYDIRPAVKEEIQSLGARFVEIPLETADAQDKGGYAKAQDESFYRRQREMMLKVVATSDVVITTAVVPGKKAPILVTREMVEGMAPGSVLVDLAAERGGNCELTRADQVILHNGVTILGPSNPPALVPYHASQMYSKNITTFLAHLLVAADQAENGERLKLDLSDEITRDTLLTRGGEVVHARVKELLAAGARA